MKVVRYKSGLILLHKKYKDIEGVSFRLTFNAGAYNDGNGKQGLAHLVEHMLTTFSNKKYSRQELNKSLYRYPNKNANTSLIEMNFLGKATKETFESLVDSLTSGFLGFTNAEKEFEDEKKIVTQEIATRLKLNTMQAYYLQCKNLYKDKNHKNVNEGLTIGTKESVNALTLKDAMEFIDTYFALNNAVVSIVGNISLRKAKHIVEKYVIDRLKEHGKVGFGYEDYVSFNGGKFITEKPWEEKKALLDIIWSYGEKEKYISREEAYFQNIITETLNSMAFKKFREENKSCYGCYFALTNDYKAKVANFRVQCENEKIKFNYDIFKEFLTEIKKNGLNKELFEEQKQKLFEMSNLDHSGIENVCKNKIFQVKKFDNILTKRERRKLHKKLENISFEEVNEYLKKSLNGKPNITVLTSPEIANEMNVKEIEKILKLK